jgi:hypothetical protein
VFVPRYSEAELREVVKTATSLSDVLRHFGLRPAGGNHRLLRGYLEKWAISTAHFPPHLPPRPQRRTLAAEIVADGRPFKRCYLKERLYEEGFKERRCEMCGQGEDWRGRRMSLILDHINGVPDDNRLENLRIVCPNCAATLDTHCGRNKKQPARRCAVCGREFRPRGRRQRHCSHTCANRSPASRAAQMAQRRVERPPYERLIAEIEATSWVAVGRRYGVSDNAVRKWVRAYERERAGHDQAA